MQIEFTKSFTKDLRRIDDKSLLNRLKLTILEIENSTSIFELPNLKYIVNSDFYYRIRVGDYRIGLKLENNSVNLIRFLHRKDIYKRFP